MLTASQAHYITISAYQNLFSSLFHPIWSLVYPCGYLLLVLSQSFDKVTNTKKNICNVFLSMGVSKIDKEGNRMIHSLLFQLE